MVEKHFPRESFEQVFEFVKNKFCLGIIPIENTTLGSIHRNYDLLLDNDVQIIGEVNLRIELHLIAPPNVDISQIQSVYSHPAALEQCRNFINQNPQMNFIPSYDTAGSVKMIAEQGLLNTAAIASRQAAEDYRMNILSKQTNRFVSTLFKY
ncbi:MAG: prephenate dehydratase domain-containing protein [Candidatus Aminicenantaceae bacterium]